MLGRDVNLTAEVRRKARPGFRASARKCAETLAYIRATSSHLWQRTGLLPVSQTPSLGVMIEREVRHGAKMARTGVQA